MLDIALMEIAVLVTCFKCESKDMSLAKNNSNYFNDLSCQEDKYWHSVLVFTLIGQMRQFNYRSKLLKLKGPNPLSQIYFPDWHELS